jgi:hypothetical protein
MFTEKLKISIAIRARAQLAAFKLLAVEFRPFMTALSVTFVTL